MEDEFHFLMSCDTYEEERSQLFNVANIPSFQEHVPESQFVLLMCCVGIPVVLKLAQCNMCMCVCVRERFYYISMLHHVLYFQLTNGLPRPETFIKIYSFIHSKNECALHEQHEYNLSACICSHFAN